VSSGSVLGDKFREPQVSPHFPLLLTSSEDRVDTDDHWLPGASGARARAFELRGLLHARIPAALFVPKALPKRRATSMQRAGAHGAKLGQDLVASSGRLCGPPHVFGIL